MKGTSIPIQKEEKEKKTSQVMRWPTYLEFMAHHKKGILQAIKTNNATKSITPRIKNNVMNAIIRDLKRE